MAFDKPIFKMLAHNDTARAVGHQGGVLIPKALGFYFPPLSNAVTPQNPTVSAHIQADLFDGPTQLDQVQTRYQYQTWGAKRSPERRITGNLGAIRSKAKRDDIFLIEKDLSTLGRYKITLLRRGTPAHQAILAKANGSRWGAL